MGTGGLDHLVKLGSGNRSGKASVIAWANGISEYYSFLGARLGGRLCLVPSVVTTLDYA